MGGPKPGVLISGHLARREASSGGGRVRSRRLLPVGATGGGSDLVVSATGFV
jgi:hypothetical protein